MRRLIFILLVIGLAIIYFRSSKNSFEEETHNWVPRSVRSAQHKIEQLTLRAVKPVADLLARKSEKAPTFGLKSDDLQSLSASELRDWVAYQGRSMNYSGHRSEELETRLRAQARTLEPRQMKQLREITLSTSQPINDRIFASYLLSLNYSTASAEEIYAAAAAEFPNHGPSVPHSEAEIRNAQEMALRYMQVDALYERAKKDPNIRNKLKLLSEQSPSESLRDYVRRRLAELR